MRAIRKLFALLVMAGIAGCATHTEEPGPPVPSVRGSEKVFTPTGPGQRLEQVVDPQFHMAAARRDYLAGLRSASVREIEKLEAFMRYEADRASGERRRAIEASTEELGDLARSVARNELESVAELDRAFAHARAALVR